ncbi:MAG: BMP family lipoprotein [Candidatus Bipolaricaulia bacterium]
MRLRMVLAVLLVAAVGLAASLGQVTAQPKAICLYFDQTGRGDLSFNDMAALGAERAVAEFGLVLKEATAKGPESYLPDLLAFARSGECALIIGVGFLLAADLPEAARQVPAQKFAFIDGSSGGIPNILGLLFKEEQGGAPAGALAALTAIADGAKAVGFVAGMEIPPVWRYEAGYRYGVYWGLNWAKERFGQVVPNKLQILGTYVGRFDDPAGGKVAATTQIQQGADVILGIAGATHLGVFDAAEEAGRAAAREFGPPYGLGADAAQEWIKPGFILASARKRVDEGAYVAIKQVVEGTFQGGKDLLLGIAELGVGISTVRDIIDFIDIAIAAGALKPAEKGPTFDKIMAMRGALPYWVWEGVFELQSKIVTGAIKPPSPNTFEEIQAIRQQYP